MHSPCLHPCKGKPNVWKPGRTQAARSKIRRGGGTFVSPLSQNNSANGVVLTISYSKMVSVCASWSRNSICQLKYDGKTAGKYPVSAALALLVLG